MTAYPVLRYTDARAAIDWLGQAFGYTEKEVHTDDAGRVVHAVLDGAGGLLMLSDEPEGGDPKWGDKPYAGRGWLYVVVEDPDAIHASAVAAGAEIVMGLTDSDYGSRDFSARDLEGNLWSFGTYEPS